MPAPDITIDDMRLRARERTDMVGSTFVSDDELDRYAEEAHLELQMRLVAKYEDFFLQVLPLTLTVGEALELPSDFMKLRGIRHASGDYDFLRRLDLKELLSVSSTRNSRPTHYFVRGNMDTAFTVLEIYPRPDSAYAMELYYTPIRSLRDSFAGSLRLVSGWSEYIVITMCVKMKDKEESDTSVLLAERSLLLDGIEKSMTPLDSGEPFAVVQQSRGPVPSFYTDPMLLEDYLG